MSSDSPPASRWDFPTVSPGNFGKKRQSPRKRALSLDSVTDYLSLTDAFLDYEDALKFLYKEDRLQTMIRRPSFENLLSERQRLEFASPDPEQGQPARFFRFLAASGAPRLLEAVIRYFGSDPEGRSFLHLDDQRVQKVLNDSSFPFSQEIVLPSAGLSFHHESKSADAIQGPAPTWQSSQTSPKVPGSPFLLGSPLQQPLSQGSYGISPQNVDLPDIPDQQLIHFTPHTKADEQAFPFSVVRDVELHGARVILTRTHTLYRESSSRCFVAFNVVFQPGEHRFKRAEISINFCPIQGSLRQPIILNIFPNSSQRWSTGPSWDLVSSTKNTMGLLVESALPMGGNLKSNLGLERSKQITSASNSTLTAAGVATSKLTIVLTESQAGDGIIYSFAFAAVLDLREEGKPKFEANVKIRWQLGNKARFPWPKLAIIEKVVFSPHEQLDGPAPALAKAE